MARIGIGSRLGSRTSAGTIVAFGTDSGPGGEDAPAPCEDRSAAGGRRGGIGMVGRSLAPRSQKRPNHRLECKPGIFPRSLQKLPRRLGLIRPNRAVPALEKIGIQLAALPAGVSGQIVIFEGGQSA